LPGPAKWPNLVLTNGYTGPPYTLLKWRMKLLDHSKGFKRVDGKIKALGSDMKPVCAWQFVRGWPVKWNGPQFDASKNELAIETLEIAHEGLTLIEKP
jgi:phage tail-like protein